MKSFDPLQKNAVTVTGNLNAVETLVFIHGFGTDQSAWQQITATYSEHYRLVLMDNVGAGKSIPEAFVQSQYLNLNAYAADVLDVCSALALDHVILVGHSVGGMIAALAAIKQPDLIAKLILIGASPCYLNQADYFGGFTQQDLNELYSAITQDFSNWLNHFARLAMANADKPSMAQKLAESIQTIPQEQILTTLCAIFQSDYRDEIKKLDKPTLLIHTEDDVFVPLVVAEYLHGAIPDSQISIISAQGHFPHISAAKEVIKAITAFLNS